MALFIGGIAMGLVFGFVAFWNRTTRLENELEDKERLLDTAVEMLRQERRQHREWQEVRKTCGSGDLFKEW